jgi:hypothetical protein
MGRTRKGGFLGSLAKSALKSAVNRSGLSSTPEYQAVKAAYKDARSAYQSPVGQAVRAQAMAPPPMARPDAQPVAQPVAQPMAAGPSLSPDEIALATIFLIGQSNETFRQDIAKAATSQAVTLKNRDKNVALLDGVGKLATEVKALHESGAPMGGPGQISGIRNPGTLAQMLPMLQDPSIRSRIATYLVTAREPGPNERRFLAGSINQLATAIRIAFQQKLLLGGKTRRQGRKGRSTRRR